MTGGALQLATLAGIGLWIGSTLLLSRVRWFARPPLERRLAPYVGAVDSTRQSMLSLESFRDIVAPLAHQVGERLARLFGVAEDLDVRLHRIRSPLDATGFRVRQLGQATAALGIGALLALVTTPPVVVSLLLLIGLPLLAFLVAEQQVASASAGRQRRLVLELPVVAEQLAMLLSAGYSLGAALNRIATRGSGVAAQDLRQVRGRVRQGVTEVEALREWSELAQVPALDRLVNVLALEREATDLGRLLSDEARSIRRDVQRGLVETMDRRGQSVWIPVTVATLVPGTIFLAIPFIEALRLFSGS